MNTVVMGTTSAHCARENSRGIVSRFEASAAHIVAEAAAWALHARACGYDGPSLALTRTYAPDAAVARGRGSQAWWCLPQLREQLHGARPTTTPPGCTFFHPPPQVTM